MNVQFIYKFKEGEELRLYNQLGERLSIRTNSENGSIRIGKGTLDKRLFFVDARKWLSKKQWVRNEYGSRTGFVKFEGVLKGSICIYDNLINFSHYRNRLVLYAEDPLYPVLTFDTRLIDLDAMQASKDNLKVLALLYAFGLVLQESITPASSPAAQSLYVHANI